MCVSEVIARYRVAERDWTRRHKLSFAKVATLLLCGHKFPDHVWGVDITYIRLVAGGLYLVALLDWHSRYVVRWELSATVEREFVLVAVERTLAAATPEIFNSDQGSHLTSPQYVERLVVAGVQISMDGKGRALDNIFTERLWRTIKYGEVYLHDYASPRQARSGLTRYMEFYNDERPHPALEYRTPAEAYRGARAAIRFELNPLQEGANPHLKQGRSFVLILGSTLLCDSVGRSGFATCVTFVD